MNSLYEQIDKDIAKVLKKTPIMFNQTRLRIAGFDEINILFRVKNQIDSLYKNIKKEIEDIYYKNALLIYSGLTRSEYEKWLDDYYIVTGYVFYNEWQRKQARYYEILASYAKDNVNLSNADVLKAQKHAVNLLNGQIEEYGIYIADKANLTKLKSDGFRKVCWITQDDKDVCSKCDELNGEVFDIDDAPKKQHLRCRCYYVGVNDDT